jgi:DNA-binding NarL/FixJ family response regulator
MRPIRISEAFAPVPSSPPIYPTIKPDRCIQQGSRGSRLTQARPNWRILVVDEDVPARQHLVDLLNSQHDLRCCAILEAKEIQWATAFISAHAPDLLVLKMPGLLQTQLETIQTLHAAFPSLYILACSSNDENAVAEATVQAGASGYIMAKESLDEMLGAIRTVLSGKIYLSYDLSLKVIQRLLHSASGKLG